MSAWSGKFVIGLTGNIGTGKSVVRRMLEHLGAYGIDADALGHRAIAQGAPGYQPVLDTFGRWVLAEDGQIDRGKLARVVFADTEALACLEGIVHPLVAQAIDVLVRRSNQRVIVIEAIKLIESSLRSRCDSLWVTHAMQEIQLVRLMKKRGMSEAVAHQRIGSQPPQEEKIAAANIVIRNDGSFEETWMRFPSQRALDIWEANGATVDREKKIVRVKGDVIEEALKKCPPAYSLAARDPQQDLPLDGNAGASFYSAEGQPPVTAQNMPRAFRLFVSAIAASMASFNFLNKLHTLCIHHRFHSDHCIGNNIFDFIGAQVYLRSSRFNF